MRRLLVLGFIWGFSFLFIKVAVDGLTPVTVAWIRIALGASALYLVLRRDGLRLPSDRLTLRHFAVASVAGNIVPFTLLAWGEQRITSALTAVLNASTPLFAASFAALARQERLRPVQVGGLGVGIVGVAVAAGFGGSDLAGSSLTGALAAIGAGACYGVAFVYMRRHLVGIPSLVAATGQLAMGAVVLAPVAVASSVVDGVTLTPNRIGAVLLLGVMGTGVAYVINYRTIAELGATKAALVTYIVPVVAVVVGIVVLDEPFEWRLVLGGLLTVAGIGAVTQVGRRDDSAEAGASAEAAATVPTTGAGPPTPAEAPGRP
jgi:drug/metabolite transporter (DMT)-like permease